MKSGGDIPALVAELKRTNTQLVDARRRLEPREQHDREQLRLVLDQRMTEWKAILRANPAKAAKSPDFWPVYRWSNRWRPHRDLLLCGAPSSPERSLAKVQSEARDVVDFPVSIPPERNR